MLRHFAYRVGRKLYTWGRGEPRNDPHSNGEYWLLDQIAPRLGADSVVLDVGANAGDWSARLLAIAPTAPKLIAFEPAHATRTTLAARLAPYRSVEIVDLALSDAIGTASFYSSAPGAGTNSLHPASGAQTETVRTTTLDAWLAERGIAHVAMAKIDVEGFDSLVLAGARQSLARGAIDLLQFEYNWRWLLNGRSLRTVFDLVETLPYRLGKLAGPRLLLFERWHFELDRFFENNYVLVRADGPFAALGSRATFDQFNVQCW